MKKAFKLRKFYSNNNLIGYVVKIFLENTKYIFDTT